MLNIRHNNFDVVNFPFFRGKHFLLYNSPLNYAGTLGFIYLSPFGLLEFRVIFLTLTFIMKNDSETSQKATGIIYSVKLFQIPSRPLRPYSIKQGT